jgi:hypothetical protein
MTTVAFKDSERLAILSRLQGRETKDRKERRARKRVKEALDIGRPKLIVEQHCAACGRPGRTLMQLGDGAADGTGQFELTGEVVEYLLELLEGAMPDAVADVLLDVEERLLLVKAGAYKLPEA